MEPDYPNRTEPMEPTDRGDQEESHVERNVRGLHHVQITIPRGTEQQGRAFYCGVLGFSEIPKPSTLEGRGGFWLQAGYSQVHVGTEDGVLRHRTKAHLAYEVDDLESWKARLHAHGIELLEAVPIPGYERFEFRDPFGNRVEFIRPLQ